MTSINILGTYSGINMDTVDQLIEAESAKGIKYTNQKAKIERERGAWKDVNSRLDNLHKKLEALTKSETFESRTVTSNVKDSTARKVTASDEAAIGTYHVKVEQLATSSRFTGGQVNVESIYENLEGLSGDLVINYGMLENP